MAVGISEVAGQVAAANSTEATQKKSNVKGKTIGEPQLSDKAAKYYEKLKAKYGNYDFILVSKDEKENAQANAASFANKDKTVVLIDEEKIERMATDADYRKKYENVLSGAKAQIEQLKNSLANTPGVKGFGMKVNDNGAASFFAAVDKNMTAANKAQQKRIEKKAAEKKEAKKKAAKEEQEERLENAREKRKAEKAEQTEPDEKTQWNDHDEDIEIVSANSIEELIKKIQDVTYSAMSDHVMTDAERAVGGHIDFKG